MRLRWLLLFLPSGMVEWLGENIHLLGSGGFEELFAAGGLNAQLGSGVCGMPMPTQSIANGRSQISMHQPAHGAIVTVGS